MQRRHLICLAAFAVSGALADCLVPTQFRVAAFEQWKAVISDFDGSYKRYLMSHDRRLNGELANDKIVSTSSDRLMNFTLWLAPGYYNARFDIDYRFTTTGFMGAVFAGNTLLTQTGMPDWRVFSFEQNVTAIPCSVAPAVTNAFGQSYVDFVSMGNQSALLPVWVAHNGTCVNANGFYNFMSAEVSFTVPAICPTNSNNSPYMSSVQPWSQWHEYKIGAQNGSKALQLRISSQTYKLTYLANYTIDENQAWFNGNATQTRAHVADYKLTVDSSPIVLGIQSRDYYQYSDGYGIVASLLYDNNIVTTTGGTSGWKATNDSSLVNPGWNWDYNYDTTGWVDVSPNPCTLLQDYGFVEPFVSDLGACAKFIAYPACAEQPYYSNLAYYYRYTFDPTTYDPEPQSICNDVPATPCPAGTSPAVNSYECNLCPMNTYKSLAGNASCLACPATMSTNTTAATSCSCVPRFGWNGVSCSACPANSFKTEFSNATCTSCSSQAYASCTGTSFTCAAGYTASADGLSCVACAVGTYKSSPGSGQCLVCAGNAITATTASTSQFSCQCAPGFGWNGTVCSQCAANTYKSALSNTACTACPANTVSCNATTFTCNAGYALSANGTTCVQCAVGTYKSNAGNGACSSCPANAQCTATSYTCASGNTLAQDGLSCQSCAVGTFKSLAGNGTCSTCQFGATTLSNGTINSSDCLCVAGLFANGVSCNVCATGTFKPQIGNTNCTTCFTGYTTVTNGSITSDSCVCQPGYEWDGFQCQQCGANKIKLDIGNTACQSCPVNAVCNATSTLCAAGYTRAASGLLCVQCASGTFKDNIGDEACSPCLPGSTNAQCSYTPAANTTTDNVAQQNQGASTDPVVNGVTLSTTNIAIFVAAVLAFFIIVGIVVVRVCLHRKQHVRRPSLTTATSSTGRKTDQDFTSTSVLQTNSYASRTYNTTANATTLMVNITEFAMPGFLQFVAGRDFRWETPLAKGGGGEVFVGQGFAPDLRKDGGDGALVVKVVATNRSDISLKASQAFDQEIAVMHYLGRHRNISQMLGWCEEPLAIIMKYYKLGDLQGFIKAGHLTTKAQLYIFAKDICGALEYMHNKGVAHRDIKAQNVFIDMDTQGGAVCVLGDFGIANIFSRNAQLVEGFHVVNINGLTIAYSAPEVIQRFRARDNSASLEDALRGDIFSVAILFFLLQNKKEAWK